MCKNTGKNLGKNLSNGYSQKLLGHIKQSIVWKIVGWVIHSWLFYETHFVWLDALTMPVKTSINFF